MLVVWAGFARSEILEWWKKRGGEEVDVPAEAFAERSRETGRLVWEDLPAGLVLRGVVIEDQARIVTRAASAEERQRFGHDRLPLLGPALYPSHPLPDEPEEPELFTLT